MRTNLFTAYLQGQLFAAYEPKPACRFIISMRFILLFLSVIKNLWKNY